MKLTIETIFKRTESEELCREIYRGVGLQEKCLKFLVFQLCGCALYGLTMGLYNSPLQAAVSSVKVFILFSLTLAICLPTLHFSGLLFGSSIRFVRTLCVLLAGTALTGIFLGAFAPISLFFLFSGAKYEFLMLMHVAIFACCGTAGLLSIQRNMNTLAALTWDEEGKPVRKDDKPPATQTRGATPPPIPSPASTIESRSPSGLLQIWFLMYMLIGAQMSYLLSPFVGREARFVLWIGTSEKGDFFSYIMSHVIKPLLQ